METKTILCRQVVWLSLGKRPEGGAETKSSGLRGQDMGSEGREGSEQRGVLGEQ